MKFDEKLTIQLPHFLRNVSWLRIITSHFDISINDSVVKTKRFINSTSTGVIRVVDFSQFFSLNCTQPRTQLKREGMRSVVHLLSGEYFVATRGGESSPHQKKGEGNK